MMIKFQAYTDKAGKARFRIIDASNGKILAKCTRGWVDEEAMYRDYNDVREHCEVCIMNDRRGDWWWSMINRAGKTIILSSEGYRKNLHCKAMARKVGDNI